MFLKLEGRPCLVIGAGAIAQEKLPSLLEAGARHVSFYVGAIVLMD